MIFNAGIIRLDYFLLSGFISNFSKPVSKSWFIIQFKYFIHYTG
jgi:hypothetical protein